LTCESDTEPDKLQPGSHIAMADDAAEFLSDEEVSNLFDL
jgi:hypothetical protein